MKEHPVLFSAPMVRAILEGRKTQTRRIMNPQPQRNVNGWDWGWPLPKKHTTPGSFVYWKEGCAPGTATTHFYCPYGSPIDRLWVRETFFNSRGDDSMPTHYRADENLDDFQLTWKPSIFMPRWASRITLEILDVRVERLQDISNDDARAEGIESEHAWDGQPGFGYDMGMWYKDYSHKGDVKIQSPIDSYHTLWDAINGKKYPWSSNPWTWVIEFKRVVS